MRNAAISLLESLLHFDPALRCSAHEALQHPYFQSSSSTPSASSSGGIPQQPSTSQQQAAAQQQAYQQQLMAQQHQLRQQQQQQMEYQQQQQQVRFSFSPLFPLLFSALWGIDRPALHTCVRSAAAARRPIPVVSLPSFKPLSVPSFLYLCCSLSLGEEAGRTRTDKGKHSVWAVERGNGISPQPSSLHLPLALDRPSLRRLAFCSVLLLHTTLLLSRFLSGWKTFARPRFVTKPPASPFLLLYPPSDPPPFPQTTPPLPLVPCSSSRHPEEHIFH